MKTITIPASFFDLTNSRSKGLISSLLKLQAQGFALAVAGTVPDLLLPVLYAEGISVQAKQKPDPAFSDATNEPIDVLTARFLSGLRVAKRERKTKETAILVEVALDRPGTSAVSTGIGFFDHMLDQIARHGNMGLKIEVKGDLHVDEHHTVEDTGITLGEALTEALGNKLGIKRYGFCLPMDDAHAEVFVDLGGRPYLNFKTKFKRDIVGEFPTELVEEFFRGLSQGLKANVFIKAKGKNDHHKIEAIFKAFAKALNEAARLDERAAGLLPSTKGTL
jgi:imidazoleglycerol-phosphate dehydratase/histidinol-phosphatase